MPNLRNCQIDYIIIVLSLKLITGFGNKSSKTRQIYNLAIIVRLPLTF